MNPDRDLLVRISQDASSRTVKQKLHDQLVLSGVEFYMDGADISANLIEVSIGGLASPHDVNQLQESIAEMHGIERVRPKRA